MFLSDSNKVIVIIPVYKQNLSSSEECALLQCISVLHKFQKCIVAPKNLNIKQYLASCDSFSIERFENKYFKNLGGYNKLLTSHKFYSRFSEYEFIFIYQLDAFVFRDELRYWCDKDYDFIGAPFFEGFHLTKPGSKIIGVGNGGFSLRKVKTHLDLTDRFSFFKIYQRNIFSNLLAKKNYVSYILFAPRIVFRIIYHFVSFKKRKYGLAEDYYWSIMIANNVKEYKVASVSDALSFAFERNPSDCMYLTNNKLPFGCHAWEKNSEFWLQYIPFKFSQYFRDVNC